MVDPDGLASGRASLNEAMINDMAKAGAIVDWLAACRACRFLRHFMSQNHDLWVAYAV
jgi:hypothetical protein